VEMAVRTNPGSERVMPLLLAGELPRTPEELCPRLCRPEEALASA
jgi:hypothetical protein